jgi:hypothetical protein
MTWKSRRRHQTANSSPLLSATSRVLDWLTYALAFVVGGGWVYVIANFGRYVGGDPSIVNLATFFVAPPVALFLIAIVIRLGRRNRSVIQLTIFSAIVALWSVEGLLSNNPSVPGRTMTEAVTKLRLDGNSVVGILDRSELSQIELDRSGLYAIGQLPDAEIVHCSAKDTPSIFQSDRHGFRNPSSSGSISPTIVALGDSFTIGSCIDEGETYVGILRSRIGPVLSLATPGNGPLSNLAGYREFVESDPKMRFVYLIWFHYQNDLTDLDWEKSSHLRRYVQPGFSQQLSSNMDVLRERLAARLALPNGGTARLRHLGRQSRPWHGIADFAKATEVRRHLGLLGSGGEWTPPDLDMFEKILQSVTTDVQSRNAQMVFVYIPSYDDIRWPGHNKEYARWDSIRVAQRLGLNVLDLTETMRNRENPFTIFPNGQRAVHYNELGHQVVAAQVIALLKTLQQ